MARPIVIPTSVLGAPLSQEAADFLLKTAEALVEYDGARPKARVVEQAVEATKARCVIVGGCWELRKTVDSTMLG